MTRILTNICGEEDLEANGIDDLAAELAQRTRQAAGDTFAVYVAGQGQPIQSFTGMS